MLFNHGTIYQVDYANANQPYAGKYPLTSVNIYYNFAANF